MYLKRMVILLPATASLLLSVSVLPIPARADGDPLAEICAGADVDLPKGVVARLKTLCNVWYLGASLPAAADEASIANACTPLAGLPAGEFVAENYDNHPLLCYFARLDHDDDGIADFRVDTAGFFTENDDDVDNDGIVNHRDPAVLTPTAGNSDASVKNELSRCADRVLPARFDWTRPTLDNGEVKTNNVKACPGSDEQACAIQARLYRDFDVLVYERGATFNDTALMAVEDVLTRVFRERFQQKWLFFKRACSSITMLKSVSAAPCAAYSVNPDQVCDENDGTLGEAHAHNSSMTLYDYGIQQGSMDLFSLLAHELAHTWQFEMDADDEWMHSGLNTNYWHTPKFDRYLQRKKWHIVHKPESAIASARQANVGLVFADNDIVPHDEKAYAYQGIGLDQLQTDLAEVGLYTGPEGRDGPADRIHQLGVLGSYSLGDPWEWHGDHVAAYAIKRLESHLLANTRPRSLGQVVADRLARVQRWEWEDSFYYRNISKPMYRAMSRELTITRKDLDVLTCRYIVHSDDYVFDTDRLPIEWEGYDDGLTKAQIIETRQALRAAWRDRCADAGA